MNFLVVQYILITLAKQSGSTNADVDSIDLIEGNEIKPNKQDINNAINGQRGKQWNLSCIQISMGQNQNEEYNLNTKTN